MTRFSVTDANSGVGAHLTILSGEPHGIEPIWRWLYMPSSNRTKAHIWNWDTSKTLCGINNISFDEPYQDDEAVRCQRCARHLQQHYGRAALEAVQAAIDGAGIPGVVYIPVETREAVSAALVALPAVAPDAEGVEDIRRVNRLLEDLDSWLSMSVARGAADMKRRVHAELLARGMRALRDAGEDVTP